MRSRLPGDDRVLFRSPDRLDTLRRRHPVSLKGVTLRSLIEIARHLKLACRPLRIELAHLGEAAPAGDPALGHEPFRGAEGRDPARGS